jgi:hypothetical protein
MSAPLVSRVAEKQTATTTLQDPPRSTVVAPGVFPPPRKEAPGTSPSAHASSSTTRGHHMTMTAEVTLRPATGLRLCLHNKSRKSSIPSKWYAALLLDILRHLADMTTRKWKSTRHPNHTPISSNDYASIIWTWRLGEYLPTQHLGIEANSICELIVSSVPFSGYDGFVSSVLASIYKQIERRVSLVWVEQVELQRKSNWRRR